MRAVRQLAYWLLVLGGLAWLATRLNRRKVLVLAYHGVYGGPDDPLLNFDGTHVRSGRFARQMRWIARRYRVVPLDALADGRAAREAGRPRAAITLDDGYRGVHRFAFPILKARSLPATLFPPTDFVLGRRGLWWDRLRVMLATTSRTALPCSLAGRPHVLPVRTIEERRAALPALSHELRGMVPDRREEVLASLAAALGVPNGDGGALGQPLSVAELRDMARHGITLGSHGTSHDSFLHLSAEALDRELAESKRLLEQWGDRPVRWVAYPHGDFSDAVADAVRRAGYRGAVTTVEALDDGAGSPYAVKRVGVHDNMTMVHFLVAVSGLREFVIGILAAARRLGHHARRLRPRRAASLPPANAHPS
jgi:peptidoglycan/xylan/chitin deacetylase (PgdA/CDA1 family)